MSYRTIVAALLAASLQLDAAPAEARSDAVQPVLVQSLPVELAMLDTHLALGFTLTAAPALGGDDVAVFALSAEGQIAIADFIELELNVPFLARGFSAGLGLPGYRDVHFGDLQLGAKIKLFSIWGQPIDFALAVYANGTLPTTSLDVADRGYGVVHAGLSASIRVAMFTLGLNTGPWTLFNPSNDRVLWNIDLFTAAWLHRMIALQLSWQLGIPVSPSGDVAFLLTPALQFYPSGGFHVDAGARIAVTDAARLFTGGRAAFLLAFAYDF